MALRAWGRGALLACALICGRQATCVAGEPAEDVPTLRQIGESHKATKDLIRSISLTLEYGWSVYLGLERARVDRWRRVPGRERITWEVETTDESARYMVRDVEIDHVKNRVSMLSYRGPTRKIPPVTIGRRRGIKGVISRYDPTFWYNPAPVRVGLKIQPLADGPSYDLDALCRQKTGVTVKGWSVIDGKRCVWIRIVLPADENVSYDSGTVDVYVDPTVGWLARKVTYELNFGASPSRYRRELVVRRFHGAGGGVFFPMRVHRRQIEGSRVTEDCLISVSHLKLNQPIPQRELTLVFPKNLRVSRLDDAIGGPGAMRSSKTGGVTRQPIIPGQAPRSYFAAVWVMMLGITGVAVVTVAWRAGRRRRCESIIDEAA